MHKDTLFLVNRKDCKSLTILFFLWIVSSLYGAASSDFNFRRLVATNGLSQSSVLAMVQDDKGFLWIGTKDGLNRFDGYEFVTYKYDPSDLNTISNNEVSCLVIEENRYLWIGTRSGGINRLELSTGVITRFSNLTYDDLVRGIYIDPEGKLWAGTSEGLLLYTPPVEGLNGKGSFVNVSIDASYKSSNGMPFIHSRKNIPVVSVFYLESGKLLIGAEEGLFEYDIKKNSFKSVSDITLGYTVLTRIIRDSKDQIWASSYDGLVRLKSDPESGDYEIIEYNNQQKDTNRYISANWVEDILEDYKGNIWLATRGAGLIRLEDDKVADNFNYSLGSTKGLPDNLINSLLIGRTGVLWLGTESNELLYLDLYAKKFNSIRTGEENGLRDNLVTAITGNEKNMWVGTSSNGIDLFKLEGNKVVKSGNIPKVWISKESWKSEIATLLCDSNNVLWIGSASNSLIKYSEKSGFESFLVNGYLLSLMEDNRGNVWFGTWGQGLGYINKKTNAITQYNETPERMMELSSDKVMSIYLDSRDYLWVGTKGGGVNVAKMSDVINRRGTFKAFKHQPNNPNSLSYNDVFDIHEDRNGNIWLATGGGLNRLIITGENGFASALERGEIEFEKVDEKQGLPGGLVHSILEDARGDLWLGTNKGLSRYSISENNLVNYGVNDGLPSGKFNLNSAWNHPNSDMIFFGGVDGLTYFHPDSISTNPFEAQVTITGFRLHNRSIGPGDKIGGRRILQKDISYADEIRLAYSDNEILFEFSALHFSSPEKNRYAYRLIGFNENWQEVGSLNRRATYTNLRFGEYLFQVRATNNDGVLSPKIQELKIIIDPPIWLTKWAYLLYLAIFVFLLFVFRKYSLIAVTKKNQFIIDSIEHKKEVDIAEAKMRFFTNVSHEIRTPLTLINAPLQQLMEKEDPDSEYGQTFAMMHRNVKRLLNQVSQLLELRKMEKGQYKMNYTHFSLKEMFADILSEFTTIIQQKEMTIYMEPDDFETQIYADKRLIGTVIYNLLSNSIKFSPNQSTLTIQMEKRAGVHNELIVFKVCDEGSGIPENDIKHIFNRFYQIRNEAHSHFGGSGIGLSIVKEFVEQHAGSVDAYNLEEKGCCIEVILPIVPVEMQETPKEVINKDYPEGSYISPVLKPIYTDEEKGKLSKLWIVEDDVDLSGYLVKVFSEHFDIQTFYDGADAFEKIKKEQPDIMICDIMLPGMNGIELTSRIKSNKLTSHIPIIILTARAEDENMVEGLTVGADNYLVKPFNIDVLKAQVHSLMKSREAFKTQFSKQMVLSPTEEVLTTSDEKLLTKLKEVTERRMSDPAFDVTALIEEMHMSHSIILNKVKDLTGMSLVEFIRTMRIQKAAQIFRQDKLSVSEVGYMVGFSDPKYFSKCFTREIGKKPTSFIRDYHEE